jgi:integrase
MPLKLVPPGTRKGNKFYLILGMEAGVQYEVSTRTTDQRIAKQRLAQVKEEIASAPAAGARLTFAQAAKLYIDWRSPAKVDVERIWKVVGILGRHQISDIRQAQLVSAATRLLPHHSPATRNREVLRPAAAILHYGAENGYCSWLRVRLFKEPPPPTRAVSSELAAELIGAVDGRRRLLLVWLFHQGTRITQTLRIMWSDINMERRVFKIFDAKGPCWREFPVHDEVYALLEEIPEEVRVGRLWPWAQKSSVYRWLRPLTRELGIPFTPHMARHSVGTWLNESGAGLRTIMGALGHADPKSSVRYQAADVEIIRHAAAKIPRLKILGKGS